MLFVFEDIVKLEERAVQQVLREADQKDLVLALRGAPDNVKDVVLTNMSERGAEMLKEEMEIQPPQRKRDVDDAQSRIVAVVRQLEEAGAIVIASGERGGERSRCLSAAVSYDFEQLEPSEPPPRDAAARLLAQATARGRADPRAGARARATPRVARAGHERWRRRDLGRRLRALGEALEGVESLRAQTVEAVEHDAIDLALSLAEKILAGALQARPELVVEVVQGALRRINDRRGIEVLVNPADLEAVQVGDRRPQTAQAQRRRAVRPALRPARRARRRRSCAPPRARSTRACRRSSSAHARWSRSARRPASESAAIGPA